MKRLILLFALSLTCLSAFGSHMSGGDIWYEYAGDSQFPHRYKIFLKLYRNAGSGTATLCNGLNCVQQICISSSCFGNQTVSANLVPYFPLPGSDTLVGSSAGSIITPEFRDCTDPMSQSQHTEQYVFMAEVDLAGICTDYKFGYAMCCRNVSDNLLNSSADNFELSATLNNYLGPNSSPKFENPGSKSLCINQNYSWPQTAIEPDGDSIYYSLATPIKSGACSSSLAYVTFAPGFSQQSPMSTIGPMVLNNFTGDLNFTPALIEVVTFKVNAQEYRFNSSSIPILIGISTRDVQLPILANCGLPPQQWLKMDGDTTKLPELNCNDSSITVFTDKLIYSYSVSPDGTDFSIVNSQENILPIISAQTLSINGQSFKTNAIKLKLHQPISYNDTLLLSIRLGSDLNTIISTCGLEIKEGDSLSINVEDCTTAISLKEKQPSRFSTFPNPASDQLNLYYNGPNEKVDLLIIDLSGKQLKNISYNQLPENIDISNLPNGIYFIRISTDEWAETSKFEKL